MPGLMFSFSSEEFDGRTSGSRPLTSRVDRIGICFLLRIQEVKCGVDNQALLCRGRVDIYSRGSIVLSIFRSLREYPISVRQEYQQ
jgi:hypothetical protein